MRKLLSGIVARFLLVPVVVFVQLSVAEAQVTGAASAQNQKAKKRVAFGAQNAADHKPIKLKSKKRSRAELASSLPHCDLSDVKMKDGKKYTRVEAPGLGPRGEPGMPELPAREDLVRIPAGAKVTLVIDNVTWQELDGEVELPPVQPPHPDVRPLGGNKKDKAIAFTKNAAAYSEDAYLTTVPVVLGSTIRIRGREYIKVIYQPVSYNPVQKKVRVAHDVQWHLDVEVPEKLKRRRPDRFWKHSADSVDVRTEDQIEAEEPADGAKVEPATESTKIEAEPPTAEAAASQNDADYLIITADAYAAAVAPLAAWKHKKGYKTYVATLTEVGSTEADIQAYIQDAYDNGVPPTYVLLVGDHEDLPAYKIVGHPYHGASHEWHVDYHYALVDGGDNYPDLYIARLPGDTAAQITAMVDKTIVYEKTPDAGAWYDDVLVAGQFQDSDDTNNIADRCFMEDLTQIADFLGPEYDFYGSWNGFSDTDPFNKGYTVHTALQWDSSTGEALEFCDYSYPGKRTPPTSVPDAWKVMGSGTKTQISAAINNGVAMVFHRDHGYSGVDTGGSGWADPDYQASQVSSLVNGNKLPFVFSLNCATGWFDECDKFAEAWMRNGNGGAVGYTGAARVSYSGYNDCFHMGIMDTFWDDYSTYDDGVTIPYPNSWRPAEAIVRAKGFLFAGYGASSTYALLSAEFFNWFGDPELQLRTATPVALAATHTAGMTVGISENVTVSVTRGGSDCQGALVALVMDSGSVYEVGTTDANGDVTLNITPMAVGSIDVTVTEKDSIPYEGTIEVVSGSDPVIGVSPTSLITSVTKGSNALEQAFTVANIGIGTIDYTISDNASWLSCSPASGTSTGDVDNVTVSYVTAGLDAGVYNAAISVTGAGAINSPASIPVQLTVNLPPPVTFYHEPMDSDPGWSLTPNWAYGTPTGGQDDTYGGPDPTSGASGANVIGYNLSGDYEASMGGTLWAQTTAIDCSDYAGVTLQFQRWLGVEGPSYDHAYIEVSKDGSNWTAIWENSGEVNDTSWTLVDYDISSVADEQSTVYVRWGMGGTDGSWQWCGWNIDEVKLLGSYVGSQVIVSESGGSTDVAEGGATDTYTLMLGGAPSDDVVINIATDSEVDVSPTSLTFTTGNWNTPRDVTVTAIDDGDHELLHTGTVSHAASSSDTAYDGVGIRSVLVNITDDDNNLPVVDAGTNQTVYIVGPIADNPVPGADVFLDAGLDDGANSTWEDSLGLWNPSIDGTVTFVADAGSALSGITSAYEFPGGGSATDGCDGGGLDDLGGADQQPVTLEIWFKPDDSGIYPANGQVLYETGGTTGFGIFYNYGTVEVAHDSHVDVLSADVSALTNEFIQVVTTFDTGSSTDNYKLYINGELKVTASRTDTDLSGTDDAGLGKRGATNVGGAGNGDASTESFDGRIAIFRAYLNEIVDANGVMSNYNSIAGSGVTVTLDGTASDSDSDPLVTAWTLSNGPASVDFDDANAVDTTATMRDTGVYTLRLTADDGNDVVFDECIVTVAVAETYSVAYNGNGSTGGSLPVDSNDYTNGATVTVLGNTGTLARAGHAFNGWNTASNGTGSAYVADDTFTILSNVVLYAQWTAVPTYTLTYNGNGHDAGSPPVDTNQYIEGEVFAVSANTGNLTKSGYTFGCWNDRADGLGNDYVCDLTYSMPGSNLALYAKYVPVYTLTVNSGSGDGDYIAGADVSISADAPLAGHHFDGWTKSGGGSFADAGATNTTYTMPANNAAVTANYVTNTPPAVEAGTNQFLTLDGVDAWTPADITTVAWYDAADSGTLWADASATTPATTAIGRWDDKSGNNYHMKQSNGSAQPVYTESDSLFGGRPSISTGPSYKYLTMDQSIEVKRMYLVTYYGDGTQTSFNNHNALVGTADGSVRLCGRSGDNHVFDYSRDGKNFDYPGTTHRNGSTVDTSYQAAGLPITGELFTVTADTAKTGQWRLLANNASYTLWDGGLGEVIFTDGTEDLATQQKIEGYLAHKWGIAGNLPVGHPHKDAAPGAPSVTADLEGFVTDADGDSFTTQWSRTNGPATMTFADTAVTNTTATFTEAGTYTLRLTADDSIDQAYDEVVITVNVPLTYTVTYDGNGSTGGSEPLDANDYTNGATVTVLGNTGVLSRVGHTFDDWNTASNGTGDAYVADDTFSIPATNVTLYAQWTVNQYTITFNSDGGSAVATQTNNFGASVTAPSDPTKAGYTFSGWSPAVPGTMPSSNITVTAQWTVNQYTITFDSAGGTAVSAITQNFGTTVTEPTDPTKAGYTFNGWSPAVPGTMPSSNITVTAQWTVNQYTITFDSAGGTAVSAIMDDFGATVTEPADPTKAGYTFNGWSPAVPGTMPSSDLTVTAQWTVNQYTITFDSAGGTAVSAITDDFGATVTEPADPTKEGYTFRGWSPAVPGTMPSSDLTVTAQWTVNQYTITFDSAGGTAVSAITQNFGTTVTEPTDPTKAGYTFSGWSPAVPGTMPSSDLTVTAQWTVNQYTITFDSAGGSAVATITNDFGAGVAVPSDPTRAGFNFSSWSPALPSTMPSSNTTCTAQWVANAAPTVAVTDPADASLVMPGTSLSITAESSDVDGTVTQISFYADSTTLIGTTTVAPTSTVVWADVPMTTTCGITAVAFDDNGGVSTSAVVVICVDGDGDDIPDVWEDDYGLSTTNANNGADNDGDGMTDHGEYIAGTIPNSSASVLEVISLATTNSSSRVLAFESVTNRMYTIECRSELTGGTWSNMTSEMSGSGGQMTVTDSGGESKRFYRIKVRLP